MLRGHSSSVRAICYSPTGTHIASASLLGHVHLWSATSGQQVARLTGHSQPINKLTFTPQGHKLITVSDDRKVKVGGRNSHLRAFKERISAVLYLES